MIWNLYVSTALLFVAGIVAFVTGYKELTIGLWAGGAWGLHVARVNLEPLVRRGMASQ